MSETSTQVRIKYNPYLVETQIWIDGKPIVEGNFIKIARKAPIDKWVSHIPELLIQFRTTRLSVWFCGTEEDMEKVRPFVNEVKVQTSFKKVSVHFERGIIYKDFVEKIASDFSLLRKKLLIDEPDNKKLTQSYAKVSAPYFRINVLATMSAGKSTLINAMLGKRLLPSRNEACTAAVIELLDTDKSKYIAKVFDSDDKIIKRYQKDLNSISNIDADDLSRLNDSGEIARIRIMGDIPFIDAKGTALMLVDTPGTNNSNDVRHQEITYKEIEKDERSIIMYVINGTQIGTYDDDTLLRYVVHQIEKHGHEVEERVLFVINKMDVFDPDTEKIGQVVSDVREYLIDHGIENPRIFVCSAKMALELRTSLKGVDVETLNRTEMKKLPLNARETIPVIEKTLDYESMHFEDYANVSPSLMREVKMELENAISKGDVEKQALIHSGVYSLEKYIALYIKGRTTRDLMEFLEGTLDTSIM